MKILIVSDTHGHDTNLIKVLKKVKPIDYLIHCGDIEGSEDKIRELAGCPCTMVKGNNDYYTELQKGSDHAGTIQDPCCPWTYLRCFLGYERD